MKPLVIIAMIIGGFAEQEELPNDVEEIVTAEVMADGTVKVIDVDEHRRLSGTGSIEFKVYNGNRETKGRPCSFVSEQDYNTISAFEFRQMIRTQCTEFKWISFRDITFYRKVDGFKFKLEFNGHTLGQYAIAKDTVFY